MAVYACAFVVILQRGSSDTELALKFDRWVGSYLLLSGSNHGAIVSTPVQCGHISDYLWIWFETGPHLHLDLDRSIKCILIAGVHDVVRVSGLLNELSI